MRLLLLGRHLYTIAYSIYTQGKCRFLSHERFCVTRAYVLFSAVSASRACSAFLSTEQCWWWHAGAGSSCSCCSRTMLTMNRRGVAGSCRTSNYAHRCPAHVISAPSPACRRWRLGRRDTVRRSDAFASLRPRTRSGARGSRADRRHLRPCGLSVSHTSLLP